MIVSRARVQYFRSIVDTGWVDIESDITTLLGKNESGKTSFLRALESVSDDDPIEERDQNYNKSPDEKPFEMVRVELVSEDGSNSIEIGPIEIELPLHVVKYSDGTRSLSSESIDQSISPDSRKKDIIETVSMSDKILSKASNQNSGKFKKQYEKNVQEHAKNVREQGDGKSLQWNINQLDSVINGVESLPEEETAGDSPSIKNLGSDLSRVRTEAQAVSDFDVSSLLPSIVYHDEFDRITDSAQIKNLDQPENRTFRNLLTLADIDYEGFHKRDKFEKERELHIAEADISGDVNSIWEQKSVKVAIDISGTEFMVQIKDDSLGDEESEGDIQRQLIRPSSRSEGFRWFFSFYTNLTAETSSDEGDKLVLLDDPAMVLHPEGKKNWLDAIERMSDNAQFIYSSHSPYLIRKEYPERIRIVEDLPVEGTRITSQWAEGGSMALKPLRNALGIGLGDSPFASKRQILVEGVTDYYIFTAINNYLKSIDLDFINSDEVSIMPTNGAPNMPKAAKWVASEEFSYVLLLDNDQEGKEAKNEIQEQHQEVDPDKVVLLHVDDDNSQFHIELEDLFSTSFYVESVNRVYKSEFPEEFSGITLESLEDGRYRLNEVEYGNRKITSKMDDVLDDMGMGDFDKVLVANFIRDRLNEGDVDKEDIKNFIPIFDEIRMLT